MTTIRPFPVWFFASLALATTLIVTATWRADAATPPRCRTVTSCTPLTAGGGRIPCPTLTACHKALAWQRKDRGKLRHELGVRVNRDASYAVRLAAAAFGVSEQNMRTIAQCESGMGAQTTAEAGSGASGVFQFLGSTWRHTPFAAFDVFDPVANSLAAAWLVTKDHGWHEWSCSSITGVR